MRLSCIAEKDTIDDDTESCPGKSSRARYEHNRYQAMRDAAASLRSTDTSAHQPFSPQLGHVSLRAFGVCANVKKLFNGGWNTAWQREQTYRES